MRKYSILFIAALLLGCGEAPEEPAEPTESMREDAPVPEVAPPETAEERLERVLGNQPDDVRARYEYRNPQETLEFFGIEPGMTVVEALPGGGWYTKILLPYLGKDGRLIGADYARDMYGNFPFATEEFMEEKKGWVDDFKAGAAEWAGPNGAEVDAFVFGNLPEEMKGTADAVLLIRAMHNLARFESDGGYLTTALQNTFDVLKPGGIVGVVQHHARDDMPDEWANGSAGYLKKSFVVEQMQKAGFELVEESDVNANDKDQPTAEDVVWRLPPSYATSGDDKELRKQFAEIGESNRMTLKFRKPAA